MTVLQSNDTNCSRPKRQRTIVGLSAPLWIQLLLDGRVTNAYTATRAVSFSPQKNQYHPAYRRHLRKHLYPPSPSLHRQQHRFFAFDPNEEIWPPTNEDTKIELSDSFIGGVRPQIIPKRASPTPPTTGLWLAIRALPAALLAVYCVPSIQPIDGFLVIAFSGYLCVLAQWSKPSPEGGGGLPTEPKATGRLPIVDRPLGPRLSSLYDSWLNLGGFLGLVLPWCLMASTSSADAAIIARPLFLLACQVVTEAVTHRFALPIRVLVSYAYGLLRLVYVYAWWTATATIDSAALLSPSTLPHLLAGAVLAYTLAHVVAVVPVLALRYLRVHFFLVEAASVELRPGMEASIGLSPSSPTSLVLPDGNRGYEQRTNRDRNSS